MATTLFYAWQADRPSNCNRGFIQRALEAAAASVREDCSVVQDPRLDKDTLGVAGSPDIVASILEKIARCSVFVADITLIHDEIVGRPCPNPNVLFELGYAVNCVGWERIILVMNTAFGGPEALPFDLRNRRITTYALPELSTDKSAVAKRLQSTFSDAIRLALAAMNAKQVAAVSQAPVSSVNRFVASVESNPSLSQLFAAQYLREALSALDEMAPMGPVSDDDLVQAIARTVQLVADFARIVEVLAQLPQFESLPAFAAFFEALRSRFGNSGGRAPIEAFYRFLGQELFVMIVQAFLRAQRWDALTQLLEHGYLVRSESGDERVGYFTELSGYIWLLDEGRNSRLPQKRSSVHADILRARYEAEPLSGLIGFSAFTGADYFLFVWSWSRRETVPKLWDSRSAVWLTATPEFLVRAKSPKYARELSNCLGLDDNVVLGSVLEAASKEFTKTLRLGSCWPATEDFNYRQIAAVG